MIYLARSLKESRRYFLDDPVLMKYIGDIINHPEFLGVGQYLHHKYELRQKHLLNVAYYSRKIVRALRGDVKTVVRAAFLHDLFPYQREKDELKFIDHMQRHSYLALKNAEKYFELTGAERDLIGHHNWPFNKGRPKHREGFALIAADTFCAWAENIYWRAWKPTARSAKKAALHTKNRAIAAKQRAKNTKTAARVRQARQKAKNRRAK
jgi:uncharacterized protein